MDIYPRSLQQKLDRSYVTAVVLIVGFLFFSWNNLDKLEEVVVAGDVVTDLFDTTLEIRRFEKNYFLYGTAKDYEELLGYVERAEKLLQQDELVLFTTPDVIYRLRDSIGQYREMLNAEPGDNGGDRESRVRASGKSIVTVTEQINADRKAVKRETLRTARTHLIAGMSILLSIALAGGIMFYKKAAKPLSFLKEHMDRISAGEFSLIQTPFRDREFVSLKAAFNRMLLELRKRQRHIIQSEKLASLGTLVFGVAHELNNPISNISTSCQILKEEIEEDNLEYKKELIDQIEAEADLARDVVSSLLEYSRAREIKLFPLDKAVRETFRLLRAEIPAKINLVTRVPDEIELVADKQKIQQLLVNLVKNAADAITDEGEIVISASKGSEHIQIEVLDNGEGMDRKTLSKIFDPFYSGKKNKTGYGLGLFIVHNIVEEHEGTISVVSEPGHGTMFTITLPPKGAKKR